MLKIGIYINQSKTGLVIETAYPLQFELRNCAGKLIVTGNKLLQPLVTINIKRLASGTYTLTIYIEGQTVFKTIEL